MYYILCFAVVQETLVRLHSVAWKQTIVEMGAGLEPAFSVVPSR